MYLSNISLYQEQNAVLTSFSNLYNVSLLVFNVSLLFLFVILSCAHPNFSA